MSKCLDNWGLVQPDPHSLFTPVSSRPPYQVRGKLRGGISLGVHQTGSFGGVYTEFISVLKMTFKKTSYHKSILSISFFHEWCAPAPNGIDAVYHESGYVRHGLCVGLTLSSFAFIHHA